MAKRRSRKRRIKRNNVIITVLLGIIIVFAIYQTIQSFITTDGFINEVSGEVIGTVVLDAGHGYNDPGCMYEDIKEKDINLNYVREIGNYLMKNGVQVYYTRMSDKRLANEQKRDLQARCDFAGKKKADYFISVHVNSVEGNDSPRGLEVYCGNKNLGENISHSASELSFVKDRGVLNGNHLYVIRNNKIPSVLIELGYIKSKDIKYLTNKNKTSKLSVKIAEGIIETIKENQ